MEPVGVDAGIGRALPPQPESNGRQKAVAICLVVLLVVGGAAGLLYVKHRSDVAAVATAEKKRAAAKEKAEKAEEAREQREASAAKLAAEQAVIDGCRSTLSGFLTKLSTVDARLDVGLDLDEYGDLVGEASVAYDGIDLEVVKKHPRCLSAGSRLENAFNKYAAMASRWNDCVFEDVSCDTDSIEPLLQRNWAQASTGIDKAKQELASMEPAAVAPTI